MPHVPVGDGWFRVEKHIKKKAPRSERVPVQKVSARDYALGRDYVRDYACDYVRDDVQGQAPAYVMPGESHFRYNQKVYLTNPEFVASLMLYRNKNGLTHKTLAMLLNEKESLISSYEVADTVADYRIVNKLNKALNARLPKLSIKKNNNVPN